MEELNLREELINLLNEIKGEDDKVYVFSTTSDYCNHYFIGNDDDISASLEYTLRTLIENGYEDEVYACLGAYIPTDDEMEEFEEFDEYVSIDLGYVIGGLIDYVEEV